MKRNSKKEEANKQLILSKSNEQIELRKLAINLIWERIKLQQEVRDRWFRYSLIILGVPLILFGIGKNQSFFVNSSLTSVVSGIFALIGFFFFLLHINQRINSVNLHAELQQIFNPIRQELKISSLNQMKDLSIKKSTLCWILSVIILREQSWGADFWANSVQAVMNSSFLFLANYNILNNHPLWSGILFLSTFAFHLYLRQKIVLPSEARRMETKI